MAGKVRAVAWLKDAGAEFAEVELGQGRLSATGVAVGADPVPYRLDYQLTTADAYVTARLVVRAAGAGWRRSLVLGREADGAWHIGVDSHGEADLPAPGGDVSGFQDALDCDLGLCPLTNTMPVLRHGLLGGGGPVQLLMAWVSVPDLTVQPSAQRYTHLRRSATTSVVRFESEAFRADIVFDADGLVVDYPGIARRARGWPSAGLADP
jgi:hypothetical protein